MSVRLMSAVFDQSEARGNDRLVLLAIADEADDDGTHAYPGYDYLAHKCRLPKSTVWRSVQRLEALGELAVTRPESKGRGNLTHYRVLLASRSKVELIAPAQKVPERSKRFQKVPERSGLPGLTCDDADTQYPVPSTQKKPSPVVEVFEAWRTSTNRTAATHLDTKRTGLITAALKNYPVEDVIAAVQGWENSPYHRGENEHRRKYNDLGLLLRDADHIERFRDLARAAKPKLPTDPTGPDLTPEEEWTQWMAEHDPSWTPPA